MPFTISIIGRPNVGKSTLFNRLTGKKHALVHDLPGVTRDRREGQGAIAGLEFRLFDTPGLEEAEKGSLESRMMLQTEAAVEESDICLLVIDGREGVTPADRFFAKWLRKKNKPVICVVNKCEGMHGNEGLNEAFRLGFEHTAPISAEHNEGMADLYDAIAPFKAQYDYEVGDLDVNLEAEGGDKYVQIAIIGRPNAGKSTLLNALFGEERVLTGPEAGITRDSIAIDWKFEGKNIRLIDTAGIRRRSNVKQKLEKLSVSDSMRAVQYAHVVVLMVDATRPLEKQDLTLAERVIDEGRAVVLAVNKWDLIKNKKEMLEEIEYKVSKDLPSIKGVPIVTLSAKDGWNIEQVIRTGLKAYNTWNVRVSTSKLNQWIKDVEAAHAPPLGKNKRRIRLKYITQGKKRPPTFFLFVNFPNDLPASYQRYLVNSLRTSFKMPGVPLRLCLRKADNPYQDRAKKRK
jgi:GTP-binding protein